MYPLQDGQFAPLNQWYVAAWSSEVSGVPLARWLLDKPMVLYRKADGAAVALDGRCPHRGFPLARGTVDGDSLECGYHGLVFGPDGKCVSAPTQGVAPSRCDIRAYPVVERWRWLWIWPGDSALADEGLIPEAGRVGEAGIEVAPIYYAEVPGRYMLMHDNLLDLTHLGYLHRTSIGTPAVAKVVEERASDARSVSSRRKMTGTELPEVFAAMYGYHGPVDRNFGGTFHAPSVHILYDEFLRPADDPEAPGRMLGRSLVYHAVTPARRESCHYFVGIGPVPDQIELVRKQASLVFDEDVEAAAEIERMIREDGVKPDILLRSDATCVTGRRLMSRLIDAEPAAESVGAAA